MSWWRCSVSVQKRVVIVVLKNVVILLDSTQINFHYYFWIVKNSHDNFVLSYYLHYSLWIPSIRRVATHWWRYLSKPLYIYMITNTFIFYVFLLFILWLSLYLVFCYFFYFCLVFRTPIFWQWFSYKYSLSHFVIFLSSQFSFFFSFILFWLPLSLHSHILS